MTNTFSFTFTLKAILPDQTAEQGMHSKIFQWEIPGSQLLVVTPTTHLMTGDIRTCPDLSEELTGWQIDLVPVQYRCDLYRTAGRPLAHPPPL